jgi:transcriptional regulator, propionate catabolism operon regulatory protein
MKARIGIAGFPMTIAIAREVAAEYNQQADFEFITAALDDAISVIKEHERNGLDIIIAGPGNSQLLRNHLNIPIVPFFATTRTLINAIREARTVSTDIAVILSKNEDYDLDFFEELLDVKLHPYYCRTSADYQNICQKIKDVGIQVVIGGSFAVDTAKSLGIRGVFTFEKKAILREAIKRALELIEFDILQVEKITQMNILLQQSNEGFFILDNENRISFLNRVVEKKLNISWGVAIGREFHQFFKDIPVNHYLAKRPSEIIVNYHNKKVVLNFHPVMVKNHSTGMVVSARLVEEIEETEKRIRQKIHAKGFEARYSFKNLIGIDPGFLTCVEKSKAYGVSSSPILIFGETGTGKEMFAQSIHNFSSQKPYPFVAINCAVLPRELIESELFGYEKGAFSGARSQGKKGLVEQAHRGTLFLDEICSLSYETQAKLLRLLQEKEFIRVGGDKVTPVNVRIISATNLDLVEAIKNGSFRRDLYYRLNTLSLKLPPLRERKKDLLPLFLYFLTRLRPDIIEFLGDNKKNIIEKELASFSFSGNIRQLQNLVERFSILAGTPEISNMKYLQKILRECHEDESADYIEEGVEFPQFRIPLKKKLKPFLMEAEQAIIKHHMKNQVQVNQIAKELGIERSTLWRKLKQYKIKKG